MRKRKATQSSPAWLAEVWRDDPDVKQRHRQGRFWDPKFHDSDRDHHAWILSGPLQTYAFEVLDKVARRHGVEGRYPFWDQRVVEACVRAPSWEKLANGWTRALLRTAMYGVIPERVRTRADKLDFSSHLVRGLLRDHALLREIANDKSVAIDDYIDRTAFAAFVEQLEHPSLEARRIAAAHVWRGASLALWLASRRRSDLTAHAPLEVHV